MVDAHNSLSTLHRRLPLFSFARELTRQPQPFFTLYNAQLHVRATLLRSSFTTLAPHDCRDPQAMPEISKAMFAPKDGMIYWFPSMSQLESTRTSWYQ
jgi:hypothetical protein